MQYTVIDFHTHPFMDASTNICAHDAFCGMTAEKTKADFLGLGVSRICGSVIAKKTSTAASWQDVKKANDEALRLRELYGDFYVPGFHVHPAFIKESLAEIERMAAEGVKLCGELVPYWHAWNEGGYTYASPEFSELIDALQAHGMILSFHAMGEDEMDAMVREHPDAVLVAAHPGEYGAFMRHMERMKLSKNYYLDVSGYGIFRHGMLRHAIDLFGAGRFLFGSDYPTCNAAMYLGGVALDYTLTEDEKRMILAENAKRLLGL